MEDNLGRILGAFLAFSLYGLFQYFYDGGKSKKNKEGEIKKSYLEKIKEDYENESITFYEYKTLKDEYDNQNSEKKKKDPPISKD